MVAYTIMSYRFCIKMQDFKNNVMTLYLIVYVVLAINVVALFELTSIGFYKDVIFPNEYKAMAVWGNRLLFVGYMTITLLNSKRYSLTSPIQLGSIISASSRSLDRIFVVSTIFVYILSVISKALGISDMTAEAKVVLPFHLNGLIDEFRGNVYPFIFAIYVFDCMTKKRPYSKRFFFYFAIYAIMEVFVRSSKGALLFSFLPVLELYAFMGKFTKKGIIKYVLPLFLVAVSLYTILEGARQDGALSMETIKTAASSNQTEEHSSPYIRTFMTGVYYSKLVDIIPDDHLSFDFRRAPLLASMNGGSAYMTKVIDAVPSGANHSSGVTGLCDALLWGGYPMGYIIMCLLVIFAMWGDHSSIMRRAPLYKVIVFYLLYRFVTGRTISFFIDELFMATVISTVIKILITKYYYKQYY